MMTTTSGVFEETLNSNSLEFKKVDGQWSRNDAGDIKFFKIALHKKLTKSESQQRSEALGLEVTVSADGNDVEFAAEQFMSCLSDVAPFTMKQLEFYQDVFQEITRKGES